MDEKIEEIINEYIEALRNPKPFKYTNEEKANALEHLLRIYKTLKITERKNFDNAIDLMIENKQKDDTINKIKRKIANYKYLKWKDKDDEFWANEILEDLENLLKGE